MLVMVTFNILLAVICLGFGLFAWAASAAWGPEGPVGAFIIPIPFLFLVLVVLTICIRRAQRRGVSPLCPLQSRLKSSPQLSKTGRPEALARGNR